MKKYNVLYIILLALIFIPTSCKKLEVENLNAPDKDRVYSTPDDYAGFIGGLYNNWFQTTHSYDGIALALWVASDHGTCSWGNSGMRDISSEPRAAWNNDVSYGNAINTRSFYRGLFSTLSVANNIIDQVVNNKQVVGENGKDTKLVEAFGRFMQGLSGGYLALVFDRVPFVDENTDLEGEIAYEPSSDVITAAVEKLDMCIAICAENTFTLPGDWFGDGETYTNVELGQLANSYAARLLVEGSRNLSQNNSLDWNRVKGYADKGITSDLIIQADGTKWQSELQYYSCRSGWGRVDMRVIHMLDPNQPNRWPEGGYDALPNGGVATSADSRLATDFGFLASQAFKPERGAYHFSTYRYARNDNFINSGGNSGDNPEMRVTENEMYLAEALAMTDKVPEAVQVINNSTYVTRGGLTPLEATASKDEVLNAIVYERTIELYLAGAGLSFFDMRRKDMLQKGTPLHFPVPGQQLEIEQMENYTFGGVANADGEGTSNGGW